MKVPCRSCDLEECPTNSITNHYQQNKLPLISCRNDDVELLSDELHADQVRKYVAISHVRSQGLGNSYSNSLPMCQMLRLQRMVNTLYPSIPGPVPFWIDTLCIPLTAPGQHLAFEALYDIYRRADETVVLDESIYNTPIRSAEQNLTRIKDSQWAQRLWTIREGAIAKSLKVQFKDSNLGMLDIIRDYSTVTNGRLTSRTGSSSHICDEVMDTRSVDIFIDQLQLLERDLRAVMDRIPPPPMIVSYRNLEHNLRLKREIQIRAVLRHCYISVPLYRFFVSESEAAKFMSLQKTVGSTYKGLTYDVLLNQQRVSPAETLQRLELLRSWYLNF